MLKETLLGLSAAIIIFLIFLGYDITPIILFGSVGLLLYFITEKREGGDSLHLLLYLMFRKNNFHSTTLAGKILQFVNWLKH